MCPMPQDDVREREMTQLFNLTVPDGRTRGGIDAYLQVDGRALPFELKSTTSDSVSTVRDFGPDHIRKWRSGLHWIFAFYDRTGTRLRHCTYASPADMEVWIVEREKYIAPDIALAQDAPNLINEESVVRLLGAKDVYSVDEARFIMKKQWGAAEYLRRQDLPDGYSLAAITDVLRARCRYVILRGATLNNPHIERAFFSQFEQITTEHASRLRELVRDYLRSAPATEDAIS